MFHAGPSLLKSLLPCIRNNVDDLSIFQGIQHASSGGDAIPPDVLESLKEIFSNAEIFAIYGPSEIACMGCTWLVPRDKLITKTYAGHPFPEMDIRIVDNLYNEFPPGVDGEVCFSGKGVFKEYLDNPDLENTMLGLLIIFLILVVILLRLLSLSFK